MKHVVFSLLLILMIVGTSYAQEETEKPMDSIALARAAADAETLKRLEKAEKEVKKAEREAKKAEKRAKKLEKEAKKIQKLQKSISKMEGAIEKNRAKINKYDNKLVKGQAKGKLSPVAISKLNDKVAKERLTLSRNMQKLEKLKRKQ